MTVNRSGVTRTVIVTRRWAVKLAWGRCGPLRGWLANRSEWVRRDRPRVLAASFTLCHFITWYRRADEVGTWDPEDAPQASMRRLRTEERKGSSWGRFGGRWLLIDYDRAWQDPRGWVGGWYYGRQERLARKWMRL